MTSNGNFGFLTQHSPLLAELGQTAEKLYPFDPPSCVLKLRLLAEALTQEMAARLGVHLVQPTQAELLRAVDNRLGLDPQIRQMFHLLRVRGNAAAHQVDHDIGWRGEEKVNWLTLPASEACAKVQSGGTPKGGFLTDGIPFLKVYNIVDQKVAFDYKPQYVSAEDGYRDPQQSLSRLRLGLSADRDARHAQP